MKNENKTETILIVDDYPDSLEVLSRILSGYGYQVRTAPNGEQSLKSATAAPPDLVLLDVMMPDINGYQVCARLKADPRTAEVPVVFLSALSATPDKIKGFEAGGVDFITKPFQAEEVYARVKTHLEISRLRRRLEAQNSDLLAANESLAAEMAERLNVQKELETEHSLLTGLINSPEDLIVFSLDTGYCYTAFNEKHREEMKKVWNAEIEIGMNLLDCMSIPEVRALAKQSIDRALAGDSFTEVQHQPGAEIYYELRWSPIHHENKITGATVFIRDISKQKQAEEAVSVLSSRQEIILTSIPEIVMEVDANKIYTWANQAGIDFFGGDVIGKEAADYFEGEQETYDKVQPLFNGSGDLFYVESWQRRKDGQKRLLAWWCRSLKDAQGNVTGALSSARDITERKLADDEISNNENRLRVLVNIFQHQAETIQGFLDYALEQAIALTGSQIGYIYHYSEEKREFILNTWSKGVMKECSIMEPQTCYELEKTGIWGEAVRQRKPIVLNDFHAAHPLKKGYPEGHVQLKKFLTVPVFKGEEIVSVVAVANKKTDYTETDVLQLSLLMDSVWKVVDNREAGEKLREKERLLHEAQALAGLGAYSLDITTGMWASSDILDEIFGIGDSYVRSVEGWAAIIHPEDREGMSAYFSAEVIGKRAPFNRVYRIVRLSDSTERWVHGLGKLEFDGQNNPVKMIGTIQDITERVQAEAALKKSQLNWQTTFDGIKDAIFLLSPEGAIVQTNHAAVELFGGNGEVLEGKHCWEVVHRSTGHIEGYPFMRMKNSKRRETMVLPIEDRWFEVTVDPIFDEKNNVIGAVHIVSDMTQRKLAEEAVKKSENLYRRMNENSPLGMHFYELNEENELIFTGANPAADRILGVDHAQFIGNTIEAAFPPLTGTEVPHRYRDAAAQGIAWSTEQVAYQDNQITGAFEVKAFQTAPGSMVAVFSEITDRRRTEEALKKSEAKFRNVFEHAAVGKSLTEIGGRMQVNDAFCSILGYTREELRNTNFRDITHPDQVQTDAAIIDSLVAGERSSARWKKRYIHKNGNIIWADISAVLQRDDDGKPEYFITTIFDITDQVRLQEELRETNEYLENLISSANAPIIVWDNKQHITRFNKAFEELSGYKSSEALGRPIDFLFPGKTAESPVDLFNSTIAGTRWESVEIDVLTKDHQIRTVLWNSANILADDGKTTLATIAQGQDITTRKAIEQNLLESNARLDAFMDFVPALILIKDSELRPVYANRNFRALFPVDEWMGKKPIELFPPSVAEEMVEKDMEAMEKNHVAYEETWTDREGKKHNFFTEKFRINVPGKEPLLGAIISDITERKQTENNYRESEAKFRQTFDNSPLGIVLVGLDRKFILCNNAFSLMLGYEPGDLTGKTIDQITYPEDMPIGRAEMKAIVEGKLGQAVVLKRYQRNDGKVVWGGVTITLVRDSQNLPLYFLAIIQDITEKKRADEKILSQLEELKRWQKVTSGREDRVRELKLEINELLIRAGQPVRYTVGKLESSGNK